MVKKFGKIVFLKYVLAKKLWRIQGLPEFLVYDSSELRNLNYEIQQALH